MINTIKIWITLSLIGFTFFAFTKWIQLGNKISLNPQTQSSSAFKGNLESKHCAVNVKQDANEFTPKMQQQSYGIDPLNNIWYLDKNSNKIIVIDTTKHQKIKISDSTWSNLSKSANYPSEFDLNKQSSNYHLWLPDKSRVQNFLSLTFFGPGKNDILLQVKYVQQTTVQEYTNKSTHPESAAYHNYRIAFWIGTFDKSYKNFNWKIICVPQLETWTTSNPFNVNPDPKVNQNKISPDFLFLVNQYVDADKISFSCFACDDLGYPEHTIKSSMYLGQYFTFTADYSGTFFPKLLSEQESDVNRFPISLAPKSLLFDIDSSRFDFINHEHSNINFDNNSQSGDNHFYNLIPEQTENKYLLFTDNGLYEASPPTVAGNSWKITNISENKKYGAYTNFYSAYYLNKQLNVVVKNTSGNYPGDAKLFKLDSNNNPTLVESISKRQFQNSNTMIHVRGYTYLLSIKGGLNNQTINYMILHLHNSSWRKDIAILLLIIGCILIIAILIIWVYIAVCAYNSRLLMHTLNFAKTKATHLIDSPDLYLSKNRND